MGGRSARRSWTWSTPLVYDQCRFNNGYPYVLTRADELAVILGEEREALETMIVQAMVRHGLPLPELSRKAQQKQVARWRRTIVTMAARVTGRREVGESLMEIEVGRIIRSSTTRFAVGCQVLRPQVPVFGSLVKVRGMGRRSDLWA